MREFQLKNKDKSEIELMLKYQIVKGGQKVIVWKLFELHIKMRQYLEQIFKERAFWMLLDG